MLSSRLRLFVFLLFGALLAFAIAGPISPIHGDVAVIDENSAAIEARDPKHGGSKPPPVSEAPPPPATHAPPPAPTKAAPPSSVAPSSSALPPPPSSSALPPPPSSSALPPPPPPSSTLPPPPPSSSSALPPPPSSSSALPPPPTSSTLPPRPTSSALSSHSTSVTAPLSSHSGSTIANTPTNTRTQGHSNTPIETYTSHESSTPFGPHSSHTPFGSETRSPHSTRTPFGVNTRSPHSSRTPFGTNTRSPHGSHTPTGHKSPTTTPFGSHVTPTSTPHKTASPSPTSTEWVCGPTSGCTSTSCSLPKIPSRRRRFASDPLRLRRSLTNASYKASKAVVNAFYVARRALPNANDLNSVFLAMFGTQNDEVKVPQSPELTLVESQKADPQTASNIVVFAEEPVSLGVKGLYGCSSLLLVSPEGAYMTHFWESWFRPGSDAQFAEYVLGGLSDPLKGNENVQPKWQGEYMEGSEPINGVWNQPIIKMFQNPLTKAILFTPNTPGPTDGVPMYPAKAGLIVEEVKKLLPNLQDVPMVTYLRQKPPQKKVGNDYVTIDKGLPQGKLLVSYDPITNAYATYAGQHAGDLPADSWTPTASPATG